MKKMMGKRRIVSVVLLAVLAFGDCAGIYVCAAEQSQTVETSSQVEKETEMVNTAEAETETEIETVTETESQTVPPEEQTFTEEELAQYYRDSVFIGDSIMVGFRNYSAKQKESFVSGIQFLAVGSYSAFNAMKPVTDENVHPLYKGKKSQVWDVIPQLGVKRVFILLGMNDISILGLEGARDKYKELIGQILTTSPDVEIHIMSTTYTLKDAGKGKLNNENLAQYNVLLQEMAEENGWGYVDVCTPLLDEEGNLMESYCSDGYVHLVGTAYSVWEGVLREYAKTQQGLSDSEECESALTEDAMQPETQFEGTAGAGTVLQRALAKKQEEKNGKQ